MVRPLAMPRTGLRLRITLWVVAYMLLLSLAVVWHGNIINERAERLVWNSLLQAELEQHLARLAADPGYRWKDRDNVALYGEAGGAALPPGLAQLSPGLHDDVRMDGAIKVVLLRDVAGRRLAVTLDVTDFEARERHLTTLMIGNALGGLALAGVLIALGLGRLAKPLAGMAKDIARLRPDAAGQRIAPGRAASSEMVVIADALNDYLARNERFVERERAFIDSASHELRTPVAVIAGASELALERSSIVPEVHHQLQRIARTARGVEQLISLLLVLAKDPQRLARISDRFRLDELLPQIVADHHHLLAGKDLDVQVQATAACELDAPLAIVQAAIGNLLRNAIEHSDRGRIEIELDARGMVRISDPGHGMSPEEISAIYARMARGGADGGSGERVGDGIGLDLIARLCEHLGWRLQIESCEPRGTRVTLDLGVAVAKPM